MGEIPNCKNTLFLVELRGPDREGCLQRGRPSMAAPMQATGSRSRDPRRWKLLNFKFYALMYSVESCFPCIKSNEFVKKHKVKIKFRGIFGEGGGAAAPCAPPPYPTLATMIASRLIIMAKKVNTYWSEKESNLINKEVTFIVQVRII